MAQNPPPPPDPNAWEDEFFKKHGVTDDAEKKAIRGRSTVFAYDRARRAAEDAASPDKDKKKKWYDE